MKFKSTTDVKLFLIDAGRLDLIDSVDESYSPDEELIEAFLKKRRQLVDKIKDFRKSQQAKQSWRHNRKKYMDGIKDFHKSTDGKRFHRNLARFLVSRVSDENFNNQDLNNKVHLYTYEGLKALSSIRTHLYIENEYYKPLMESLYFDEISNLMIKTFIDCELNFLENKPISDDNYNLMLESIDTKILAEEISFFYNLEKDNILNSLTNDDIYIIDFIRELKNEKK
jgi:hypothetical protein